MCFKHYVLHAAISLLMPVVLFSQAEPIENIKFYQISFGTENAEKHFSAAGMLSFDYEPPPNAMFLNMQAYSPFDNEPFWIVRNFVLLGSKVNTLKRDTLCALFRMDSAGYPKALPGNMIFYNYTLTPAPLTQAYDFTAFPVISSPISTFSMNLAYSGIGANAFTDTFFIDLKWLPGINITNAFYYGCNVPNYDLNGESDENGCGPAAAANSMTWMENKYGFNIPGNLSSVYGDFNNLMRRMPGSGVSLRDFIRAKLDFIEMYGLPIIVEYQADNCANGDQIPSSTGESQATCRNNGKYPDKNWLYGQGQAGADIEAWVTVEQTPASFGLHIITITGGCIVNGNANVLFYKHDRDQTQSNKERAGNSERPGTTQEMHYIREGPTGRMYIDGFSFGGVTQSVPISRLVTERYDSSHKPRSGKLKFQKYCTYRSVMVAPRSSVSLAYPTNDSRSFNCTVYTEDYRAGTPSTSSTYTNIGTWNNNSGETRTYTNNNDFPQRLAIHDDDRASINSGKDAPYEVEYTVTHQPRLIAGSSCQLDETTPGNPEEYAGFSIGFGDSQADEFGIPSKKDIEYIAAPGSRLCDFPSVFGITTETITIKSPISKRNIYWDNLELRIAADSVIATGKIAYSVCGEKSEDTIEIIGAGEYIRKIKSRIPPADSFNIILRKLGNTACTFDYMAVAPVSSGITNASADKSVYCAGDSLGTGFVLYYKLPVADTFSIMLSDKSGSFGAPREIGRVAATKEAVFRCIIPADCKEGSGYRVRAEALNLNEAGTDNGSDITIYEKPPKKIGRAHV